MNKLQFDFSHCNAKCFSYVSPPTNISCQLNPSDPVCLNKRWRKFEGCMNLSAQWTPTPIILEDIGIEVFHIVLVFVFSYLTTHKYFLQLAANQTPTILLCFNPVQQPIRSSEIGHTLVYVECRLHFKGRGVAWNIQRYVLERTIGISCPGYLLAGQF